MKLTIHIVDAFTDQQFAGNSAAVIILQDWLPDTLMQSIATQNNLSETAFVVRLDQNKYHVRWFSPITEIAFCGHATLAAAYVLFSTLAPLNQVLIYAEAVGEMLVMHKSDGRIQMDFPSRPPQVIDTPPTALLNGLSIAPNCVLMNEQAYFAVYDNETDVTAVVQNTSEIKKLAPHDVVVTAPASNYDFVSRYFWPANGSDEDPVTGSIHTGLAPYWAARLGKQTFVARQASERGGVLYCGISDARVLISGHAVPYLEGTIEINTPG